MSERILSVLVEDKPGVLARVALTISRRGFNINSLSVGPTNIEGRSKMTIVTELESVEQVKKQLNKLVNVIKIVELDPDNTIESEVFELTGTSKELIKFEKLLKPYGIIEMIRGGRIAIQTKL